MARAARRELLPGLTSAPAKNDINSKGFEAESYMSSMVQLSFGLFEKARQVSFSSPLRKAKGSPVGSRIPSPRALNLASVSACLRAQLRTSKMEELLHQHVSWAAEIKNLDSDMQMLVYENYSKFISAR